MRLNERRWLNEDEVEVEGETTVPCVKELDDRATGRRRTSAPSSMLRVELMPKALRLPLRLLLPPPPLLLSGVGGRIGGLLYEPGGEMEEPRSDTPTGALASKVVSEEGRATDDRRFVGITGVVAPDAIGAPAKARKGDAGGCGWWCCAAVVPLPGTVAGTPAADGGGGGTAEAGEEEAEAEYE